MNTKYVNNTGSDIILIMPAIDEFIKTWVMNEDLQDIFTFTTVKGLNDDGSDRIIVDWVQS